MHSALVTYQVNGTVKTLHVTGAHIAVQMLEHATTVTVSEFNGGRVVEAHLFRRADHVAIQRGLETTDG